MNPAFDLLATVLPQIEQARRQNSALWARLQGLKLREAATAPPNWPEEYEHLVREWNEQLHTLKEQINTLSGEVKRLEEKINTGGRPSSDQLTEAERWMLWVVLARLGLLPPDQRPPVPDHRLTGVRGHSRLFVLHLPGVGGGRPVIVKFDHPDRARKEWEAIANLQLLALPPETILPFDSNVEKDGLIVYPAAGAHLQFGFVRFDDFLRANLRTAARNCIQALDLALDTLRVLYKAAPGITDNRLYSQPLKWDQFFGLLQPDELHERALKRWPGEWNEALPFPEANGFPNPFHALRSEYDSQTKRSRRPLLNDETGYIRLSQVHGDLNLTNILVCPEPDQTPHRVYIIDVAGSKPESPTVLDIARLEVEFWVSVFAKLAVEGGRSTEDVVRSFLAVRDLHDRADKLSTLDTATALGAFKFAQHLYAAVAKMHSPQECPRSDYYHALFFQFLDRLRYEDTWETDNALGARLAVVGAAAALKVIGDLKAGRYSSGANEKVCFGQ